MFFLVILSICPSFIKGFLPLGKFSTAQHSTAHNILKYNSYNNNNNNYSNIQLYSFDVFTTLLQGNLILRLLKKRDTKLTHDTIKKIKELLEQNKRVILLANSSYTSNKIREMLLDLDSIFRDISIYSSFDYKIKKNINSLYSMVSIAENIDYKNWQHFTLGKNILSARGYGINVASLEYRGFKL